ncbi:hypothetical protein CJF42_06990 [Pseudoalteromonas sp. NBT06-2]|uniref:hypothetical protein n=1 Tax=Pseudoalteromonas sp. NBT06-2 TaxID=2025950 RepID=UPI000BA59184|nr:hypothetical protein [Pseudoalteromonas sp. NBT06-2]PAJ75111.1 hypothetical protein CJF42_06990 [Pseudoalteromonas sp. NBT06-2]
MKNLTTLKTSALLILSLASSNVMADNSAQHTSKAVKHSALAVTHGVASTATVASAVVAVPLIVAGSASLAAGTSIAASSANSGPLVITEKTITVDPAPKMVMKKDNKK